MRAIGRNWLTPGLDTQWLKVPLKHFKNHDFRSLENIYVDFKGEGTLNALTDEDWWEAPGLVTTYSDELFAFQANLSGLSARPSGGAAPHYFAGLKWILAGADAGGFGGSGLGSHISRVLLRSQQ
jgi:hypothetical protein